MDHPAHIHCRLRLRFPSPAHFTQKSVSTWRGLRQIRLTTVAVKTDRARANQRFRLYRHSRDCLHDSSGPLHPCGSNPLLLPPRPPSRNSFTCKVNDRLASAEIRRLLQRKTPGLDAVVNDPSGIPAEGNHLVPAPNSARPRKPVAPVSPICMSCAVFGNPRKLEIPKPSVRKIVSGTIRRPPRRIDRLMRTNRSPLPTHTPHSFPQITD
jgi:hypothetical protein